VVPTSGPVKSQGRLPSARTDTPVLDMPRIHWPYVRMPIELYVGPLEPQYGAVDGVWNGGERMSQATDLIDDVRRKIAPSDDTLKTARDRLDTVLAHASEFPEVRRVYRSGSIAHRTANDDTDADGGIVIDRRKMPHLGPDGDDVPPNDLVNELREFLRTRLKQEYPDIAFRLTKRAIQIRFNEPNPGGTDPSVDLIVALTRAERGLWIPNLEQERWDASDPETHTRLLTSEPAVLRRTRAHAIRLAKRWNGDYAAPGLISFNIEALALQVVEEGMDDAEALLALFSHGVASLKRHLTPDPAGVSRPIKLRLDRDVVVKRLSVAARKMRDAVESDDPDRAQDALANLFPKWVEAPAGSTSRAALASSLRKGNQGIGITTGFAGASIAAARPIKTTRAYGAEEP